MRISRRGFLAMTGGTALAVGAPELPGSASSATAAAAPRGGVGAPLERVEAYVKVSGTAPYAFEHAVSTPTYLHPVLSRIARGRITSVDTGDAEAIPGVLAVLTHTNAPRLVDTSDAELSVLQSDRVAFRGQFVAAVVAETSEAARQAAGLVRISYAPDQHDAELSPNDPGKVSTVVNDGDLDGALARSAMTLDRTYTTPMQHNNPMEPHATIATWTQDGLTLHESSQGVHSVREAIAPLFGLHPNRVRVISPHVGGGFGCKGLPHAPTVLAAMAAKLTRGRPVKYALTRQQMFSLVGYRSPTMQRIRLGADASGRLIANGHDGIEQTSRIKEYSEDSAKASTMMYAAPHRRITTKLVPLDVPVSSWMRAPGKCPGMFAVEMAMDEMAEACRLDPIEFRIRNEPERDPETGRPWSSRNLVACLREGARRFGWWQRDPKPASRRDGEWWVGTGVAASVYPTESMPGSVATIRFDTGRYAVFIGAADLGTGTWTTLAQIAADALGVDVEAVDARIGSTEHPKASVAGGSTGMTSWGSTIVETARAFRAEHGANPPEGAQTTRSMPRNPDRERFSMAAFGAQFAEVRVHADTGELRVPRMLGVFAAGRIINPRTARSQFLGGMTMGLSMALHEHSVLDPRLGHVVTHDLAEYHIAAHADVAGLDVTWIDEHDPYVNPVGSKGIGEIGIVGAPAAVANAAYHAAGIRVCDLPLTPEKFLC